MNLSEFIPDEYIPAIITASVALLAAIGAQFLNSWLTYRRENKKYKKEVYEKFISEHLMDILAYPRALTRVMSEKDIKKEVNISIIIDDMFKKVHYGDERLQSAFLNYKTIKYYTENNWAEIEKSSQFRILYYFLLYSNEIFEKIGFKLDTDVKSQLKSTIKEYAFLYIYTEKLGYEEAKNKLIGINRMYSKVLENFPLKDFEKKEHPQIIQELDEAWDTFMEDMKEAQ
ncbi:hypothetical protein P9443_19180 [Peribacillus frigoritolerans]|uniref:hypothetical protein n=1 Tax=Peribacillus frigoritolerans TaxID=450367 RepID=UPI002E1AE62A|nr:hypothetical protein [Peribacillus frigoritolerans]